MSSVGVRAAMSGAGRWLAIARRILVFLLSTKNAQSARAESLQRKALHSGKPIRGGSALKPDVHSAVARQHGLNLRHNLIGMGFCHLVTGRDIACSDGGNNRLMFLHNGIGQFIIE
jgi:hypothetical protein